MDSDAVKNKIREIIVNRLNLDIDPATIGGDTPLFDHAAGGVGLDSVDALEVAVAVTSEFDIEVADQDVPAFQTVNAIASLVQLKRGAAASAAASV
jgi:acyl carrier protein